MLLFHLLQYARYHLLVSRNREVVLKLDEIILIYFQNLGTTSVFRCAQTFSDAVSIDFRVQVVHGITQLI